MIHFHCKSRLAVSVNVLSEQVLTMNGVNHELSPWINMSAPDDWQAKAISNWPENTALFHSWIRLFGVIPIDCHTFRFSEVSDRGFNEASSSWMNKHWQHTRTLLPLDSNGVLVSDRVAYQSRLGPLGWLFLPVYKALFKHRHRRLRLMYQ